PLQMIGIDSHRRRIDVILMPPPSTTREARRYDLSLLSPPPTKHDAKLEDSALKFASDTLACEVRQVRRGENEADAGPFYDRLFKTTEGWFQQANELKSPSL
ncbi:MAG TPA: hypothetical protein VMQ11_06620, partial [Alphaproteobacteria bacterium]|nr:hypothetical protein [Alphaproteobacteria bacterium]